MWVGKTEEVSDNWDGPTKRLCDIDVGPIFLLKCLKRFGRKETTTVLLKSILTFKKFGGICAKFLST